MLCRIRSLCLQLREPAASETSEQTYPARCRNPENILFQLHQPWKPENLHVRSLITRAAFDSHTCPVITYCVSGVTLKLARSYLYDLPRVKWETPNCVFSINNKDGHSI
jgi:hypothetical protein